MRVTERIVAWDALLVCMIRIRLQGCMVTPALGSVSSLWIDILVYGLLNVLYVVPLFYDLTTF